MSNAIAVELRGRTLIIRFSRPEIRNPLSVDILDELNRLIDEHGNSTALAKIIFTGTDDVFASGANLREIAALTSETAADFARRGQNLMAEVAGIKKPTIAAINGYCFGGALDLALACSKRIASPNATFSHPGAGLGIITGWGGTQRLPRLIGQANALELFYTAEPIAAGVALRIGLIDGIADDLMAASMNQK